MYCLVGAPFGLASFGMVEAAVSGCKLAALEVLSPFVRIGVLTRLSGLGALFALARIAGDCTATYQLLSY
jgi:hydrogenase/urease accessory protein HupE